VAKFLFGRDEYPQILVFILLGSGFILLGSQSFLGR
jgi:hypothetical protein